MWCGHGLSSVVWSRMWPGPRSNVVSMNLCSRVSSHVIAHNKSTVLSVRSVVVSGFVLGLPPSDGFLKNSPSDRETWSIRCHVGIHVDYFTSILHSHTLLVPSSKVGSELGPAPPFPPMRVLEVWWSWALSRVCEVALGLPHANLLDILYRSSKKIKDIFLNCDSYRDEQRKFYVF